MIDSVRDAAHQFEAAARIAVESGVDAASLLPGWSRRHVIAHVVLNAEAFVHVAAEIRRGARIAFMYPGPPDRRADDIERLVVAPIDELLARLTSANAAFAASWSTSLDARPCATGPEHPEFSSATVPLRRLRELQVHMIDLGVDALTPSDWLESFVDSDLPLEWPTVQHRTTSAVEVVDETGERWTANLHADSEHSPVTAHKSELLAWVLDRTDIAGLPALHPWRNRSTWEQTNV